MDFEIKNIFFTGLDGFVAKADITIGDVAIMDVKLIKRKDNTYFLGMPSRKIIDKDIPQYITICGIQNIETRKAVIDRFVEIYTTWCA